MCLKRSGGCLQSLIFHFLLHWASRPCRQEVKRWDAGALSQFPYSYTWLSRFLGRYWTLCHCGPLGHLFGWLVGYFKCFRCCWLLLNKRKGILWRRLFTMNNHTGQPTTVLGRLVEELWRLSDGRTTEQYLEGLWRNCGPLCFLQSS